jgi:hypothetical protein
VIRKRTRSLTDGERLRREIANLKKQSDEVLGRLEEIAREVATAVETRTRATQRGLPK